LRALAPVGFRCRRLGGFTWFVALLGGQILAGVEGGAVTASRKLGDGAQRCVRIVPERGDRARVRPWAWRRDGVPWFSSAAALRLFAVAPAAGRASFGAPSPDLHPRRPKRMRSRTYRRLEEKLYRHDAVLSERFRRK
jgi:hypothetical protein